MKLQKIKGFCLLLVLLLLSLSASSNAWAAGSGGANSGHIFIGPELGYGILSAGEGAHLNWGITVGSKHSPPWVLSVFYEYIPLGGVYSPSGVSVSGSEKFWGFQLAFDFAPMVTGLTVGARLAMSSFQTQTVVPGVPEDDETHTGAAWGPVITYDRAISGSMSVGFTGYIMIPSETAANNVVGVLGTLKFWFL